MYSMDCIWTELKGTRYAVSTHGDVKNNITNHVLSPWDQGTGYLCVDLYIDGKEVKKTVHRLVASVFIGEPDVYMEVNHKDGDKYNNNASNLEYMTSKQNHAHAVRLGLIPHGDDCTFSKLTSDDVLMIRGLHFVGFKLYELAILYDVALSTVSAVVNHVNWRHI